MCPPTDCANNVSKTLPISPPLTSATPWRPIDDSALVTEVTRPESLRQDSGKRSRMSEHSESEHSSSEESEGSPETPTASTLAWPMNSSRLGLNYTSSSTLTNETHSSSEIISSAKEAIRKKRLVNDYTPGVSTLPKKRITQEQLRSTGMASPFYAKSLKKMKQSVTVKVEQVKHFSAMCNLVIFFPCST